VLPPLGRPGAAGGEDITRLRPEARVRRGLVRTFQINQLFADLTPLETLALAVGERLGQGGDWRRRVGAGDAVADEVTEVAERFGLADVLERRTDTLPYGKQRLLEIAAAFACAPKVLLLDEPAAGVPEAERRDILNAIAALPDDVSVLLIEHDMDLVFSFARRISVLVDGGLLVEGEPSAIANDPRVRAVYLGESRDG
jgi:branched-chain amino acid transport system ATP-binding protein